VSLKCKAAAVTTGGNSRCQFHTGATAKRQQGIRSVELLRNYFCDEMHWLLAGRFGRGDDAFGA
jgi:hypothetical protein